MAAGRDWDRLAEATRERRVELGMTQEDVRAAGGPSTATMRLIEGALQESYQPATLRDLEKALHWERGSAARLLAGGDPVPVDGDAQVVGLAAVPALNRTGQSFPVSRDKAVLMAPHVAEINGRLSVWAQRAIQLRGEDAIGEIPDGSTIFPDRPQDAAWWDELARKGFLGEPFTLWQMVEGLAILRVGAEERQGQRGSGGVAAGLMRRLTRTGRNPPDVTIRSHSAAF